LCQQQGVLFLVFLLKMMTCTFRR